MRCKVVYLFNRIAMMKGLCKHNYIILVIASKVVDIVFFKAHSRRFRFGLLNFVRRRIDSSDINLVFKLVFENQRQITSTVSKINALKPPKDEKMIFNRYYPHPISKILTWLMYFLTLCSTISCYIIKGW